MLARRSIGWACLLLSVSNFISFFYKVIRRFSRGGVRTRNHIPELLEAVLAELIIIMGTGSSFQQEISQCGETDVFHFVEIPLKTYLLFVLLRVVCTKHSITAEVLSRRSSTHCSNQCEHYQCLSMMNHAQSPLHNSDMPSVSISPAFCFKQTCNSILSVSIFVLI